MSLSTSSRPRPDESMVRTHSRCSAVSGVSSSSCVKPSTPFIGVRSSWLMVARNSLLARFEASAIAMPELAFSSAARIRYCSPAVAIEVSAARRTSASVSRICMRMRSSECAALPSWALRSGVSSSPRARRSASWASVSGSVPRIDLIRRRITANSTSRQAPPITEASIEALRVRARASAKAETEAAAASREASTVRSTALRCAR